MITADDFAEWLKLENIKDVARETGLHYNTLYKLRNGRARNLTLATYNTLEQYFASKPKI